MKKGGGAWKQARDRCASSCKVIADANGKA